MIPVVTNCELCPALCKARTKIINGTGSEEPRIVFVGDIPLEDDDTAGRPFMGKAGNILYELCQLAGIDMEYVYLTNACRCRAPKGRNPAPTSDEVKACRSHLLEEIKALNPKVVVTLGGPALASLVGGPTAISKVMGQIMYTDDLLGIPFIPTYHPRYLLAKRWDQVPLIVAHLKKANRAVDGINQKMGEYHTVKTVEELEMLADLLTDPKQTPILAFDTETTGLSWMEAELLCITFSGQAGEGWTVPLLHRTAQEETTRTPLDRARATKLLLGRTVKGVWAPLKQISPAEEEWIESWRPFILWWRQNEIKGKLNLPPEVLFLEEKVEHSQLEPFWADDEWDRIIELIQQIFGSAIPKAGQNVGFDVNMLERSPEHGAIDNIATAFGFEINNVAHDSKTASGLLHETLPKNLTLLTAFHTDMPFYEASVAGFKSHMQDCSDDDVWVYGAADADVVSRVLGQLLPELDTEGSRWLYDNISIPLIRCATQLEKRGIMIDQTFFDKLCKYYTFQIKQAKEHLVKVLGRELKNPTYWQTLQDLLWGEFDLPLPPGRGFRIKSAKNCDRCNDDAVCSAGHASTGGETLSWLMERSDNEALPILHSLKTLEKFSGTYLDGGKGGFKRHIKKDSRIHPRWSPGAAETGRFTCEAPNAMNPPKSTVIHDDDFDIHSEDALREMMVAPEGKVHMNADWSQLEVWVLAYETGDKKLLSLLQGGEDVHTFVARELCKLGISSHFQAKDANDSSIDNVTWRALHEGLRGKAKVFTFGLSYGLTEEGAATRLGCTVEQARLLINAFMDIFPGLRDYFARIREQLLRYHVIPNRFNRFRHFPEVPVLMSLGYHWEIDNMIREAVNYPIQSGGHDLHSLAHIMHENTPSLVGRAAPILELHDSLLMEAVDPGDPDYLVKTAWMVKSSWEKVARDTVIWDGSKLGWECLVEVEWGRSFGAPEWKLDVRGKVSPVEKEIK